MKLTSICLAFFLVAACHGAGDESGGGQTVQITDTGSEIQIPSKLWDAVEGKDEKPAEAKAEGEGAEGGEGKPAKDESGNGAVFMPVTVILEEKNAGVLKHSPLKIELPRGGGAIDLADYMGPENGSFFVKFEWPDADEESPVESWYVSRARRRHMGDEFWGAGCNKYFKITQGLVRANKEGGIKVNTTHERHLTVLGGHFVFSSRKNHQNFVAQVTFKDSLHPEFFCQEL